MSAASRILDPLVNGINVHAYALEIRRSYANEQLPPSKKALLISMSTLCIGTQWAQIASRMRKIASLGAKQLIICAAEGSPILHELAHLKCKPLITDEDKLNLIAHAVIAASRSVNACFKELPQQHALPYNTIQFIATLAQPVALLVLHRHQIKTARPIAWRIVVNLLGSDEGALPRIEVRCDENFSKLFQEAVQAKTIADLKKIPSLFYNDRILKKYCCPISKKPIRFIATVQGTSPEDPIIRYEQTEVLRELSATPPKIPKNWPKEIPCAAEFLKEDPVAQEEIDAHLSLLLSETRKEPIAIDSSIIDLARRFVGRNGLAIGDKILANPRLQNRVSSVSVRIKPHIFNGTTHQQKAHIIEVILSPVIKPGRYTSNLRAAVKALLGSDEESDYKELEILAKNQGGIRIIFSSSYPFCDIETFSMNSPNKTFISHRARDLSIHDEEKSPNVQIGDLILAHPTLDGLISYLNVTILNYTFQGSEQPIKTRKIKVGLSSAPQKQQIDPTQLEAAAGALLGSGRPKDLAILRTLAKITLYFAMDETRYEITPF